MKLTYKDKLEIYSLYKEKDFSFNKIANKYNLNRTVVWYIVRLIERHGPKIVYRSRNKKYSKEFKKAAIDRVLLNGETYVRVSIELGLSNVGLLHSWIKSFLENGYNVVEKNRGRKPYEQKARKQDEHLIEARKWTFTKAEFTPYHRERILKKIRCLSSEKRKPTKEEIAQAITELRQELLCSLRFILEVINSNPNCPSISRSDYYYHLKKVSKDLKNKEIMSLITEIYYHHKKHYGYRRITLELANRGLLINHKKVKRLMKLMGLFALTPKAKYRSYKGDLNGVVKSHLLIKVQDEVAIKLIINEIFQPLLVTKNEQLMLLNFASLIAKYTYHQLWICTIEKLLLLIFQQALTFNRQLR